jgi:hypothetical protein
MTSNILHHLRELQVAWRRQDFVFTSKQQEEYDVFYLLARAKLFVVSMKLVVYLRVLKQHLIKKMQMH